MWERYTIFKVIKDMDEGRVLVPAIQRDFVWKLSQIETLFNSIANGYPIGMFLFWELSKDEANNLGLYRFVKDYRDGSDLYDAQSKQTALDPVIAVLDGQQRLSSLYISLLGSVKVKKKYSRKNNLVSKSLYLNLFADDWEFKFLANNEAQKVDCTHLWFPVKKIIEYQKNEFTRLSKWVRSEFKQKAINSAKDLNVKKKVQDADNWDDIVDILNVLHQKFTSEEVIQAYKVQEKDINRVAEIFVRVNSGGTILTKTDLIFSAITSKWGEFRDRVKDLLSVIRSDSGYVLKTDFVVKTAFAVIGESLKTDDILKKGIKAVEKIKENWDTIEDSILETVSLLQENNVDNNTITSKNALIPIAVYFALHDRVSQEEKDDLFSLFLLFLVKQYFSGHSDKALGIVAKAMRGFAERPFDLNEYVKEVNKNSRDKTLTVDDDDIENLLSTKKGSPMLRVAWLLLYPDMRKSISYHEDHIHPTDLFRKGKKWLDKRDLLPNIEFIRDAKNLQKNKTPFDEWIKKVFKSKVDFKQYADQNHIPYKEKNGEINYKYYSFGNFERFFKDRKELIRNRLKKVLGVK